MGTLTTAPASPLNPTLIQLSSRRRRASAPCACCSGATFPVTGWVGPAERCVLPVGGLVGALGAVAAFGRWGGVPRLRLVGIACLPAQVMDPAGNAGGDANHAGSSEQQTGHDAKEGQGERQADYEWPHRQRRDVFELVVIHATTPLPTHR